MIYLIDIKITNKCNMTCSYCSDKNHNSSEVIDIVSVKNFIDSCLMLTSSQLKEIQLWGGEPTTEPEILNELMKFCHLKGLKCTVITNGYHIDEILETAKEYNTKIQISYDGIGSNFRRGNTSSVLGTFSKLDKLGIEYKVKPTISPYDFEKLSENYFDFKMLQSEHSGDFGFRPTIDYVNRVNPEDLPDLLNILDKQLDIIIEDRTNDINNWKRVFNFTWFLDRIKYNCGAGRGMIGIDTDGKIYPCHVAFYIKEKEKLQMGDISNINQVFESIKKFQSYPGYLVDPRCNKCDGCNKICPAARFASSDKTTIEERWCDVSNYKELCDIQTFISNKTRPYWVRRS